MSRVVHTNIWSAYGYARKAGYEGTEEEFEQGLKKSAEAAGNAEESASTASEAATEAEAARDAAAQSAESASTSEGNALEYANSAAQVLRDAQAVAQTVNAKATEAAGSASRAENYAQTATTKASEATTAAGTATSAASSASGSAHAADASATAAAASETNAAASASSASTSAGSASESADEAAESAAAAQEVKDSIPADYTALSNEVTDLKSHFDVFDNRISTGVVTYEKTQIMSGSEVVSRGTLYQNVNISFGNTDFASIPTSASSGAYALKIPIAGAKRISYPTFKSTGYFGCFMLDANDIVVWGYSEPSADTGTIKSFSVPDNANWFLLSVPASLMNMSWDVVLEYPVLNSFVAETDMRFGVTYTKAQARETFVQYSANRLYQNNNVVIGTTKLSEIPFSTSNGAYALLVDVSNADYITYPVFKSSGYFGSFILDSENVVIWAHDEKNADTGTLKTIQLPTGAAYMLLSISTSLASLDWTLSLIKGSLLYKSDDSADSEAVTPFEDINRNMCLAGIKTDILTNKIPFHRGFLFHKLQNDDGSLWYGSDFEHINKIGTVSFSPSLMRFAISPKDGRIIVTQRDSRNGMWIWDGTTETRLNGFSTNPMAWLYNSGVDFINDGNDEYCIFAEYNGTTVADRDLHVWRGKYPYTSSSDWEIVLTQKQQTDISHFHMVRRDPWTNILYLTAGDSSAESKWWYSTDCGATWTLLVSGTDTGWGNSLCRTINFVFTEDYVYWATDHGESSGEHHTLNRIQRNQSTGVLDLTTKEQLTLLPKLYATNSLCYVESPNGLFMYDRIDTKSSSVFGEPIKMLFWDFATEQLVEIASLKLTTNTWGGSRGKCYINYTNSKQPMPAMGFSIDTPCIFDLVCDNPSNIGTIVYNVGSKTVRTIEY